ncbi:hypothetical protein PPL_00180 [Heterostelium album PN500]|uniref:Uncharacterized protein n=1 Tax=Heterostelium pallidum (strain ATCC 26659 / Pp 5 / PN500) TaxID=670386 RepID=D3AVR5_HETP5|nr:hypothetical protein PPL_00180 [Heterostelium album PN500]EFA86388.1 hypothetical protein PPL_00180 [Heterostelium album PN500]|eukprot:XP_020438493.1 hypothetical protein PPL_00180 [Heterostelium album PN500]
MKDSIALWVPIDINVNAEDYQIPTIENQKDALMGLVAPAEEGEDLNGDGSDDDNNHFGRRGAKQETDPMEKLISKRFKEFVAPWIDVMSYSHNVSSEAGKRGKPHVGELTCTKFTCDRSPAFNYMSMRGEIIPHIILRFILKSSNRVLPIIEYEMHHVQITNVSVSGGTGGKPVETLSLNAKIIIIKNIKLNLETGEFETYQVAKWDQLKGTGSKTLYSNKSGAKGTSKTLLEIAKKSLMVDLDSHDPSTVALLKEMGIVTEYELPQDSAVSEEELTNYSKVLTHKDPILYQIFKTPKPQTIENYKKTIAETLSIPVDTIKNLYNETTGILINEEKFLKISTSFIVQKSDGKTIVITVLRFRSDIVLQVVVDVFIFISSAENDKF